MIILHIRRCVVWSFFFVTAVIVHVAEVWRRDGVTVTSKSWSLSLGGYADGRQLLSVARACCPRAFDAWDFDVHTLNCFRMTFAGF